MLKFGTSGLRGLVTELTDKECYLYTTAFLKYLSTKKMIKKDSIAVAGDLRPSTEKILKACIQAITDSGLKIDYCGTIPTQAVSLYGFKRNTPSIMITGSHIPYDRNGIKFNLNNGEILKKDEESITEIHSKISADGGFNHLFDEKGTFKKSTEQLPDKNKKAELEYIERYLQFFEEGLLKNKTIVIYQHSAVGRDIVVEIFEKLGAKVIPVECSEEFIPIDTESIQENVLEKARLWAKKYEADAIVSTDGDSDRPALFDENGSFIRGDMLGIICSEYLRAESVSAPISCNTALEKYGKFKKINRTKIGSPYVIEAMDKDRDAGIIAVSYEANGGYLTAQNIELNGRSLRALPTRDSVLPMLSAISLSIIKNLTLSELIKTYPKRYTWTETVKNFPTEIARDIIDQISQDKNDAEKIAKQLFDLPSTVKKIDYTDGARMLLANGEFVHIRPSGNAPELRLYFEANTLEKAIELARNILIRIEKLKK